MTLTAIKTDASDYPAVWASQGLTLPGADLGWLQQQRRAAADVFAAQGMPNKSVEDWKYSHSRLKGLASKLLPHAGDNLAAAAPSGESAQPCCEGLRIVLVDGQLDPQQSNLRELPSGLTVQPMAQAASAVEKQLGSIASVETRPLGALNLAWFNSGVVIKLARKAVIRKPLIIEHQLTAEHVVLPRIVVVAEAQSELQIIEHYRGEAAGWINAVTEIDVQDAAHLTHTIVQELGDEATLTADIAVRQARDCVFSSHRFDLGGQLARTDLAVRQVAENAEANLNGLYMPVREQHHDVHTWLDHDVPHGISRELYKGVLDHKARAVFNGMVRVARDAQKIDSEQANHNLLLSREAEVDTKPELEIYADDVKCAHGATVGELDKTAMFYLRSRGLDEEAAEALLTWAFAAEMVERQPSDSLREYLTKRIAERMQQVGSPAKDQGELA